MGNDLALRSRCPFSLSLTLSRWGAGSLASAIYDVRVVEATDTKPFI